MGKKKSSFDILSQHPDQENFTSIKMLIRKKMPNLELINNLIKWEPIELISASI